MRDLSINELVAIYLTLFGSKVEKRSKTEFQPIF